MTLDVSCPCSAASRVSMGLEVLLTSVGALALTDFGALVFGLEGLGLAAVSVFRGTGSPPRCMKKPAEAGRSAISEVTWVSDRT